MAETQNVLKQCKARRGYIKAAVTKFSKYLDTVSPDSINTLQIQHRLSKVEGFWSEFHEIQLKMEILEDTDIDDADVHSFDENYYNVVSKAGELLKSCAPSVSNRQENSNAIVQQQLASQIRLPKVSLPTFAGAFEEWIPFYETYSSLIHNNETIPNVQKFHYLISSLSGQAKDCISELQISADNYEIAWNTLKDRYNNKRLIIKKHMQAIHDLPATTQEHLPTLRQILDGSLKHTRALKTLGRPTEHWDDWLTFTITNKIDRMTNKEWETGLTPHSIPTFTELTDFLSRKCQTLEAIQSSSSAIAFSKVAKYEKAALSHVVTQNSTCTICKNGHPLWYCPTFQKMSTAERVQKIKALKLCLNCLKPGHYAKQCVTGSCKKCGNQHNTLLHFTSGKPKSITRTTAAEEATREQVVSSIATPAFQACNNTQVLLSTAVLNIADNNGKLHKCRALLDSGSQSNFILKALADKLKLEQETTNVAVIGINQGPTSVSRTVQARIHSRCSAFSENIKCLVLTKITDQIPISSIEREDIKLPRNVRLADPEFYSSRKIDMLIGAELFWNLLCVGQIKLPDSSLIMHKTQLGWVISGRFLTEQRKTTKVVCNTSMHYSLDTAIAKFWKIEECYPKNDFSPEDALCEEYFLKTYRRNENGRFIVKLPTKSDSNQLLGNSKEVAVKRFYALERKLTRQAKLREEYVKFMDEYLDLGHMKLVLEETSRKPQVPMFYLPHHAVVKEDSITTKVRVVFDASAASSTGLSLNDTLMVGPVLQEDLFSITCRFRTYEVVIAADITKMYRQILLDESQRSLQRIVWRSSPNQKLESYELNTVTYGTASASYLAIRALRQLAIEEARDFPMGSKIVLRDFYVDDLLTGAATDEEAKILIHEVDMLLKRGCFQLRKWASNRQHILSDVFPSSDEQIILSLDKNENMKMLGLQWDSANDVLQYAVIASGSQTHVSKRTILSQIAQIFDPLGLIGPVIVKAKIFMQTLWQLKVSWDESLPFHIHSEWDEYRKTLRVLGAIKIQRKIINSNSVVIELHGFCDASERAYGACIYIRGVNEHGEVTSNLICSKSRVAPLKYTTIPRLELCAALLLSRLMTKTSKILNLSISDVFYWTDSTIVLSWINSTSRQWKTFVGNRVSEIQELTDPLKWHHIRTDDNPADFVSRGAFPAQISQCALWWNGPSWLMNDYGDWPEEVQWTTSEAVTREKRKAVVVCNYASNAMIDIFARISTFTKLIRVTAYCLRFKRKLISRIKRTPKEVESDLLTPLELDLAAKLLIKIVQAEAFPNELKLLKNGKNVHARSNILCLNPFIDENGIMRVGGRLRQATISHDRKHPILLPNKHDFTKLLIRHYHQSEGHAGIQGTLSKIRNHYWPVSARSTIRQVIRKCVICFKAKPVPVQQIMGDLPASRVQPARPFVNTGIDYCGPFVIRNSSRRNATTSKVYIAVFVCMAVKAIHLELVTSLSTESFISALKRFISRRGMVSSIHSDNGTNFTGAHNELEELRNLFLSDREMHKVTSFLSHEGISWHFIPPRAPHFGGIWEAAVKSVKYHLKRVVGNSSLTYEEMYTTLCQIEAILNSRPLTPMSSDPNDLSVITPGHFLIGDSLRANLEPTLTSLKVNRLSRLQLLDQIKQHFWSRWSKEYLHQLQQRNKWKDKSSPSLQSGQLVVVKEDNLPPMLWLLGRIQAIHPGPDGVVRTATIRTHKGEVKRATNRLCLLPID